MSHHDWTNVVNGLLIKRRVLIILVAAVLMAACRAPEAAPIATPLEETAQDPVAVPTDTPTPISQAHLTICSSSLPSSLFRYDGIQTISKQNILAMLQEPGFVREGGELTPDILSKVPTQGDGDLRLEAVPVQEGQLVVDAQGELVVLKSGVRVNPSGCRQAACAVAWEVGAAVEMDQMAVDFKLKPGLIWSDGTPVTAADSQFSYLLASDPQAPGLKWAEERTADYRVLDPQTVQWVGRPGFTTAQLDIFFWTPLPALWFTASEGWDAISSDPRWAGVPPSYGPYVLSAWETDRITLRANSSYREGAPLIDTILYQRIAGGPEAAWDALQSGECDVLDASFGFENDPGLLTEIAEEERFTIRVDAGRDVVQLVFGIQLASYEERPDILGDPLTRQGLAACLDREALIPDLLQESLTLWQSFLPPEQSHLDASSGITHDPDLGRDLLAQAGWVDHDDNPGTPLQAGSVANVPVGTPLSLVLAISQTGFHQDAAAIIQNSLQGCGVGVEINQLPEEEYYATGPEGPLFGRHFDLALIAWQTSPELGCDLYLTNRIPDSGNVWIGTNIAGFSNMLFDDACVKANQALPDEASQAVFKAETVYLSNLPAVPLFAPPRISIYPSNSCNRALLESDQEIFNHIENLYSEENCP